MPPEKINTRKEPLYFIAIIPPQPIYDEALELKNYFKENYQSKASLNSPPHITLHMPFQWKERKENELAETLLNFATTQTGFEISLRNFACFEPRVIYIDVVPNEKLTILQQALHRTLKRELNIFNANYKDHAFHPHVTLAFRDLKKSNFHKAWEEFKERKFESIFSADEITLLKHDGKIWLPHKNFKLTIND